MAVPDADATISLSLARRQTFDLEIVGVDATDAAKVELLRAAVEAAACAGATGTCTATLVQSSARRRRRRALTATSFDATVEAAVDTSTGGGAPPLINETAFADAVVDNADATLGLSASDVDTTDVQSATLEATIEVIAFGLPDESGVSVLTNATHLASVITLPEGTTVEADQLAIITPPAPPPSFPPSTPPPPSPPPSPPPVPPPPSPPPRWAPGKSQNRND